MPELVAVEGRPGPEFATVLQRCWDAGDAVFPVDHRLPAPEVERLYQAVRPTRIGTNRVGGRPTEDGDALVVATSGTTGVPKAVVLTRDAVLASARATSARLGVDADRDTWICCLPVAHAGGLGVVTRSLLTGTDLVIEPEFDAATVTGVATLLAAAGRRPLVSLVATALRRVRADLFRVILLGGDRPPPERAPNVVVTYGMTETGGGCVYDGTPLDGVELDVVGGEVHLRGPVLGRAYRTADADVPFTADDGWLATGDGGRFDGDGRLVVDGRLDDVIVTGGEKVWPGPIEDVISRCAGVGAVMVVGRPDPEWGQKVVALVVPSDGDPPELRDVVAAVRAELAPWTAPKELELVTELPRTAGGKVSRAAASRRR
jgi:O-succinylbenzoic acid--CoA ligase